MNNFKKCLELKENIDKLSKEYNSIAEKIEHIKDNTL